MSRQPDEDYLAFAASVSDRLFRTACLLTADRHLAEDLVQETLGKLFVAWRRVSSADNPGGYAHTTLVRTYISHRRWRSSTELPAERLPERASYGGSGYDPALRVTLVGALDRLPAKDRAVLVLRYWEDLSVEQTATALGLSAGAVRNRSMRALDRMRLQLGDGLRELAG